MRLTCKFNVKPTKTTSMKRTILTTVLVLLLCAVPGVRAQDVEVHIGERRELTQAQKDSIYLAKLSPEQLMELKRMEMEVEKERIEARSKNEMPFTNMGLLLIVLAPFLFVIAIILINTRSKQAEARRRYEIYMKSIEMGQPVPAHFFDEPDKKSKSSNLKRGIISLMVGLAFGAYAIIDRNTSLPFLLAALIPGLVGIGYILVHKLEKPQTEENAVKSDEQN